MPIDQEGEKRPLKQRDPFLKSLALRHEFVLDFWTEILETTLKNSYLRLESTNDRLKSVYPCFSL